MSARTWHTVYRLNELSHIKRRRLAVRTLKIRLRDTTRRVRMTNDPKTIRRCYERKTYIEMMLKYHGYMPKYTSHSSTRTN
jgi:hypothetical protein